MEPFRGLRCVPLPTPNRSSSRPSTSRRPASGLAIWTRPAAAITSCAAGRAAPGGPRRGRPFLGGPGAAACATRCSRPASPPACRSAPTSFCSKSAKGAWAWCTWPSRRSRSRRRVALKIIKPGMDTRQVIARFEAERQALAVMDHPNIAKVLDAGTRRRLAGRTSSWSWSTACPSHSTATSSRLTPRERLEAVRAGLPGDPARSSKGDHSPRHQADQRARHAVRRPAGPQGDRLWRGQSDRATTHRADPLHPVRHAGRHAGIYEPGAGGDECSGRRYPQRYLLAGRAALRVADRQHAAKPQAA